MAYFRIKELIKEKGYTQVSFAEKLGMSRVGLAQILACPTPSITTLEKIARNLEVNLIELFADWKPSTDNETLTCPKCGAKLELKVKE